MEIVVKKDRVVRSCAQQLLRFSDVIGYVDKVALKARREPFMSSSIIIQ
jgi:hypothetical protein